MDVNLSTDADLHRKLSTWDRKLDGVSPPSYDSLVEYLCRRVVSSRALDFVRRIVNFVIRWLLYFLGFEDAHRRIQQGYDKDAFNNCWYCPKMSDDRFGTRPGETFLDASTLPTQVQVSYALVIRGTSHNPSTSVLDGLGEDIYIENNNEEKNDVIYPDRIQNEANYPMVQRATSLILSILKARQFYTGCEFKPDTYKDKPLTMQWYSYLFSSSIQFHRELIERYKAPREYSRHIVVMYQGMLYKVEILRKDVMGEEVMPTYEEIKRQLERILQMATKLSTSILTVSPITTLPAMERFLLEQNLKEASDRNRYNFATIRDSLLVISLDPEDSPRTANDTLFVLQSKNFTNRWYDRSVNLVVFGNGVAGFVMNYLCGMTGMVVSSFVKLVKELEEDILQSLQGEHLASHHDQIKLKELASPSLLIWDDTHDEAVSRKMDQIIQLRHGACPFIPVSPSMFKLNCGVTRDNLIGRGVSPSGTFHAALQLALLRMCRRTKSVFEIISIRHFQFGGLAWMETNTADMRLFITAASEYLLDSNPDKNNKQILRTLLKRATTSYREDVLRHKEGEVHLWHLDAIYRTLGLQTRLPRRTRMLRNLRSLLQQPLIDYLRSPGDNNSLLPPSIAETFTSNPSWNPAVEAVGRVGVKSMLPMGVHYLFSRKSIAITVSSSQDHPCHGKHREFAKEVEKAFVFINELLQDG